MLCLYKLALYKLVLRNCGKVVVSESVLCAENLFNFEYFLVRVYIIFTFSGLGL